MFILQYKLFLNESNGMSTYKQAFITFFFLFQLIELKFNVSAGYKVIKCNTQHKNENITLSY